VADSQLTAEWNVVNGADVYEVYLDGDFYANTVTTMKVIKGLVNGQVYRVQVRVITKDGEAFLSESKTKIPGGSGEPELGEPQPVLLPPGPPQIEVIMDDGKLIPYWKAVEGAVSYEVYLDNVLHAETDEPGLTITNLTNGTEYSVKALAKNSAGQSPYSKAVVRTPQLYIRDTCIGMGFDLFGPLNNTSVSLFQIVDRDKLNAENAIVLSDETQSTLYVATGEQMKDIHVSMSASLGMGASVPFKVLTFSGGITSAFGTKLNEQTVNKWAAVRGENTIKQELLSASFNTLSRLKDYLTYDFLCDLEAVRRGTMQPEMFFRYYGHAMLVRHYLGGSREIYFKYDNKKNISTSDFRTAVNTSVQGIAGVIGANTKLDYQTSTKTENWQENSEIRGMSNGGDLATFWSLEQFFSDYSAWVSSIYDKPVFAGIPNYANSFHTVWEIAKALDESEAADKLQEAFITQAYRLAEDYENRMPGEWFTMNGEEYLKSNTFTQLRQYADTGNSKTPATIKYILSLSAGGGGGQGYSGSDKYGQYDRSGGGGGSGSIAYITFMTNEDTRINLAVGKGGKGSAADQSHNAYATCAVPGENGGNTAITWNGVTVTAGGGTGGGGGPGGKTNDPKRPNGDFRGGAGGSGSVTGLTDAIIFKHQFKYFMQDGNSGQEGIGGGASGAGPGGAAVVYKGIIGAAGGRGGIGSQSGSNGEDGKILIRYYRYLGE
jgi:hypothetical protein